MEQDKDAELFKNIGQSTRLKIMEALLDGEKNVSELQEIIGDVPQGRLSTHLTWLRHWKYVYTRRDGKYIYYGIQDPRIPRVIHALFEEETDVKGDERVKNSD